MRKVPRLVYASSSKRLREYQAPFLESDRSIIHRLYAATQEGQ
jgi:hypothetical protein